MASPTKSLSSDHRMHSSTEFDSVFKAPSEKVHNTSFLVLAKTSIDSPGTLGLVVGKKNIPKAVARNQFKRIARESFRHHRTENIDIVVLAKRPPKTETKAMLRRALDEAFLKIAAAELSDDR
jgi:ribonuclease P protein component